MWSSATSDSTATFVTDNALSLDSSDARSGQSVVVRTVVRYFSEAGSGILSTFLTKNPGFPAPQSHNYRFEGPTLLRTWFERDGNRTAIAVCLLVFAGSGCRPDDLSATRATQNGSDGRSTPNVVTTSANGGQASTALSSTGEPVAEPDEDLSLPEEDTARIWDREHHANLLNKYGFKSIGKWLKDHDADGLSELFATDFAGEVLQGGESLQYQQGKLVADKQTPAGELQAVDRDRFIRWLLDTTDFISQIEGSQVGVLHIGPRESEEGPWQVHGVLRVWGRHGDEPAELRLSIELTTSQPTQKNLEDGHWLRGARVTQVTRSQSDHPLFADRTQQSGIETRRLYDNWNQKEEVHNVTGGMYATDFNRDGNIDLLITDDGPDLERLYEGTGGGTFVDATSLLGRLNRDTQPRSSTCAAFVDLDGDGYDDLICADGVIRQNAGGKRFRDVTGLSNFAVMANISHPLMGMSIAGIIPADFDRDGKLDLFIARIGTKPKSWLVDTSTQTPPCQLLRNVGQWRFEDVTGKLQMDGNGRSTFTAVWSDFNSDGWPDLYTINEFGDGILYVNQEGQAFEQRDIDPNVLSFGGMGAATGDVDNDGNIDVYAAEMYSKAGSRVIGNMRKDAYSPNVMRRIRSLVDGSEFYRNRGGLQFEAVGRQWQVHDVGWAWGPVLADFDNDGWLDIYATAGYISRDRNKPDG